jgi:peptide-methionine (R)-S-oxide reductase
MSGNQHPTEKLSEFVDYHLNPFLKEIPSYIKDTNDFVNLCNDIQLKPNERIITLDVSSLYTNIPHKEGIAAVEKFMTPRVGKEKAQMIAKFTEMVLTGNIFEFNGKLFLQKCGTAMGSKMAPSYACIYMHIMEQEFLSKAPIKPRIWKRYIDDIFCIIAATDQELEQFMSWINSIHPTIKFTLEDSLEGIPFLDTFVKRKGNKIDIRPYTKPTDKKQYIIPESCHPPHIFKSLPYSQALRIQKITSDKKNLQKELTNLQGFFINRGYNKPKVQMAIQKAKSTTTTTRTKKNTNIITMIITYHPSNPKFIKTIHKIVQKHRNNLPDSFPRIIIAYRRTKNLKEMLTRAKFSDTKEKYSPPPKYTTADLRNRPQSTYDRNQVNAKIRHLALKCTCGETEFSEEFEIGRAHV